MKKTTKTLLSILLAILMVFAFAGCGGGDDEYVDEEGTEQEEMTEGFDMSMVEGTWKVDVSNATEEIPEESIAVWEVSQDSVSATVDGATNTFDVEVTENGFNLVSGESSLEITYDSENDVLSFYDANNDGYIYLNRQ